MNSVRDFLILVYLQDRLMPGPRPLHLLRSTLLTTFTILHVFLSWFHFYIFFFSKIKGGKNQTKNRMDSEDIQQRIKWKKLGCIVATLGT